MRFLLVLLTVSALVAGCGREETPRTAEPAASPASSAEAAESLAPAPGPELPPPAGGGPGASPGGPVRATSGTRETWSARERPSGPERPPRSLADRRPTPRATPPGLESFQRYSHLEGYQEVRSKSNPFPMTDWSVERGQEVYAANCAPCHGDRGRGDGPAAATLPTPLRDLGAPWLYSYGAGDQALFRTIAFGIPESVMGQFGASISEEDIWHVVNYIKSLRRTSPSG